MFQLTISKTKLLNSLLIVVGAVDKKQALPILANVLLQQSVDELLITATDLEIEITAIVDHKSSNTNTAITVPARKFVDIIRSLEDNTNPSLYWQAENIIINTGSGKFKLATLPAKDFPLSVNTATELEFSLSRVAFISLLQATHFALSQHDLRIFLNSLLIEIDSRTITAVATDGHRMAIYKLNCKDVNPSCRFLLSRKCVQEILRLLQGIDDEEINFAVGSSCLKVRAKEFIIQARLMQSRFPPYIKAIPKNQDKIVLVDSGILKRALARIMILTNEKSRAILLYLKPGCLTLEVKSQTQEEAVEILETQTEGGEIKIALNANYLLDLLNFLNNGLIKLSMTTANSSILAQAINNKNYQYIIMPMKL